jgi:uncharacterized protein YbaP (TraB family)
MPMTPAERFRPILSSLLLLLPFSVSLAFAEEPQNTPPEPPRATTTMLEPLVVTGVQPGPGLWKVRRDGHTMYVLGTVRPLPRRMDWESAGVVEAISRSRLVLLSPSAKIDADVGMFRGLFLLPSLMKATKNPDGDKLVDQVPTEDYARWRVLKKRYLGNDRSVEKRRPLFAAQKLYQEALEHSGLTLDSPVGKVVSKAVKKYSIPVERPRITVKVENPKEAIREFSRTGLDDVACFRGMLDHVESDLPSLRSRASAWARGDVIALREIGTRDASRACMDAVLETRLAEHLGISDLPARVDQRWMETARAALREHDTVFAVLPMAQILEADGYLEKLRAEGYEIVAP